VGTLVKEIRLVGGAWMQLDQAWMPKDRASELFEALTASLPWEQRDIVALGKPITQPRLMAWAGELPYHYSGQTLEPRPWSAELAALRDEIAQVTGEPFNHLVANLYRDGRDHIAWHADNEPELGKDPVIAALSLGSRRRFHLENKRNRKKRRRYSLAHGSLLIMGGTMQHTWRHSVPKEPADMGPRINVTLRTLKGPPGWRGSD